MVNKFRYRDVWLDEGEFLIVPGGVEHTPVAAVGDGGWAGQAFDGAALLTTCHGARSSRSFHLA